MEQAPPSQPSASLVPSAWVSSIREISMRERKVASFSLAVSFATDPLSVYLVSGDRGVSPEQTWNLHLRIMSCTFAAYRLRGIVTTIGPDYDAIAMWTPPGKFMDDWWATLRSGTWLLAHRLPPEARKRFVDELVPALHNTRAETMGARNNETYYLGYIGTKPSARGKGYASRLIRAVTDKASQPSLLCFCLALKPPFFSLFPFSSTLSSLFHAHLSHLHLRKQQADAENRPMYLESSAEDNNGFYAKSGFKIKTTIQLRRGSVPVLLYCMVREPQPSQLQAIGTDSSNEGTKM